MKLNTFSVPYPIDERMIYAKEYLEEKGYEYLDDADKCDFVLLPIPSKKYMLDGLEKKVVFYGAGNFDGYDNNRAKFDYNKNESFLLENAYLTCEGAVALYKESSDKSVYGAQVLIVGYGRIAKALHRVLNAMGAHITVCSRSEESKTQSTFYGARHIGFDELKNPDDFDIVFNTVAHMVFTKNELDALKSDVVLIDLASFPGGVDTLYAKAKGINLIDGKRLPARYSRISAGRLIGKTVDYIIKEELT